jgi:outer membrane protein OmpA-like peptidoglycan-associated protein
MRAPYLIKLIALLLCLICASELEAQFYKLNEYSITANTNLPLTDLNASPGAGIRMNLRNDFLDRFSTDLELGASLIQGNGWSGMLVPIGLRYKFIPKKIANSPTKRIVPFATVGANLLYYNNLQLSDSLNARLTGVNADPAFADFELQRANGLTLNLPLRVGMSFEKSDFMDFEFSVGYDLILSDALDRASSGQYDGMLTFGFGVNFKNRGNKRKDSDGDGIRNYKEVELGLDPMNPDSDSDGLLDGEEVNLYGTNPLNPDSDYDGLMDGNEVMVFFTDPKGMDTDMDGMSDYDEVNVGRDPLLKDEDTVTPEMKAEESTMEMNQMSDAKVFEKSMDNPDQTIFFQQDKKNITSQEITQLKTFVELKLVDSNTKVLLVGHSDLSGRVKSPIYNAELSADRAKAVRAELEKLGISRDRIVIKSYGFDKQKEASEELKDQNQLFRKVDLLLFENDAELAKILENEDAPKAKINADLNQVAVGEVMATLYFQYGKSALRDDSFKALQELSTYLAANGSSQVVVEGHTDAIGPVSINQNVSIQRANSIKAQMVSLGVNSDQIQTAGFGESRPIRVNDTEAGRSLNRRIEIILVR